MPRDFCEVRKPTRASPSVTGSPIERAAERFREDHGDDPVDAVHGARKDLEKARALLRLSRPGMPAKAYLAENRRLRNLGASCRAAAMLT